MATINKAQKGKEVFKKNKPLMDSLSKENMKVLDTTYKAKPAVAKAKDGKWIQSAIKKPGALRKSLGVKKGEKIPAGKLAAAAKKPGKMGQRARLAQTLKKMKKK